MNITDFKEMSVEQHKDAEILRLRMGYEGCGCSICQELYKTTDLSVYGSRVKQYLAVTDAKSNFKTSRNVNTY